MSLPNVARSAVGTSRYGKKRGAARMRHALILCAGCVGVGMLVWLAVWVKQNRGAKMEARPASVAEDTVDEQVEYVPPFKAFAFDGSPFSIATYEGKGAVVIDFWASWCELCEADMARLRTAVEAPRADQVTLIGIHRGDTEPAAQGIAFAARVGISYLLVQDPDGKLFALLGQGKPFMPLTLFIDQEGRIMDRRVGPKTEEEIRVSMTKIVVP